MTVNDRCKVTLRLQVTTGTTVSRPIWTACEFHQSANQCEPVRRSQRSVFWLKVLLIRPFSLNCPPLRWVRYLFSFLRFYISSFHIFLPFSYFCFAFFYKQMDLLVFPFPSSTKGWRRNWQYIHPDRELSRHHWPKQAITSPRLAAAMCSCGPFLTPCCCMASRFAVS
jgi:hypothetical protein